MASGGNEGATGIGALSTAPGGVGALDRGARVKSPGYLASAWRRFRRNRLSMVALAVFVVMVVFSYGAPLIATVVTKQNVDDQDLQHNLARPGTTTTAIQIGGPHSGEQITTKHWLGTDELGRDVLTRLAYGGRISLTVAFLALVAALTIGLLIGLTSGYYGRWVDTALMRFVDVILAVPSLFVLILISALVNNNKLITNSAFYRTKGWLVLPFVIAALGWTGIARLIRGEVLAVKARDYVDAARVLGASNRRIMFRHVLPNVIPIIIIWATLQIPSLILTEASLSYLGFGVQIPTPSWGNMLTKATQYFTRAPYLIVLPGVMIYLTVMAVNLMGNGLRDALDPYLNE